MRPPLLGSGVLVTGGAGFIGSHLVDRLLDEGAREVIVLDNLFLGSMDNIAGAVERGAVFYRDDAEIPTSIEYVFERHEIDIVFNAATKALNYSFINPKNAFDTNTAVILNLLEQQRKGGFKTLCHFSSSEVYGTAIYEPMDEKHPLYPTTTYAAGKAAADIALEAWVRMFDLDAFIVRPFNNFGPRQNYLGPMAGVIPATIRRIMDGKEPEIHGSGEQCRDFIFVMDTVNATIGVYDKMKRGESVNLSTEDPISISSVIQQVCELMGYRGEIARKPARKSDVECHNASIEKIRNLIDYRLTPWDEGLAQTVEWYKETLGAAPA